LLVVIKQR